jgi:sulfide:quinone oxidoreductase
VKTLLILGAGTGGTIVASYMADALTNTDWEVVVVDRDPIHYYQPGFLYLPFGLYTREDVIRPREKLLPSYIKVFYSEIERIDPVLSRVYLAEDRRVLHYDALVIATGCEPVSRHGDNVFDFYTLSSAEKLADDLRKWQGGRLALHIPDAHTKYPVAGLEFLYLADWYFRSRHMRDRVELVYATTAQNAFPKPINSPLFWHLCKEKGIEIITRTEADDLAYDLLVAVPEHRGAAFVGEARLGNESNFMRVDPYTLQSTVYDNIWSVGDAADLPDVLKAGSAAHFMAEILTGNLLRYIKGQPPVPRYDGHTTCVVDTGFEKAVLLDYNAESDPSMGRFPLPGFGPFPLVEESTLVYRGKKSLRWLYWNAILKGTTLPLTTSGSQQVSF